MDADTLTAILQGVLLPENSKEVLSKTLPILIKVLRNAGSNPTEDKFKRLKASNTTIRTTILDVPGATEYLDACGFVVETSTGDLVLGATVAPDALLTAAVLLESSLAEVSPSATVAKASGVPKVSGVPAPAAPPSDDYERTKREAEARNIELRRRAEADRLAKEKIKLAMKREQAEVRSRPIVASHAVERPHHGAHTSAAGGITTASLDRELDKAINSDQPVLVQFTATWCGPCKMISPEIEKLPSEFPTLKVVKVDIDENQESAQRMQVRSVPTFFVYKRGSLIGQVGGASIEQVKDLVRQAV